jgi:hypothetical protein
MKIDFYTRAVLTVIAIMLSVIACNQVFNTRAIVYGQSSVPVQFSAGASSSSFYIYNPDRKVITAVGPDGKINFVPITLH